MVLVWLILLLFPTSLVIVAFIVAMSASSKTRSVEQQMDGLRADVRKLERALAAARPAPAPPAAVAPTPPPPLATPIPPPAPTAERPREPAPPQPAPASVPAQMTSPAHLTTESIVGGLWLQNVGSVLVLLGVFFLILWGYNTGHLGPGALVAAAVVGGAIVAWRGDRMARRLPALGHALVGVGLGIVYLALYLGHFVLHVMPTLAAYSALAVTSLLSLQLGRHYRAQAIQVLAVVGAFVPFVAPILVGGRAEISSVPGLLAYLALVNAAVFVLAARDGFSALALESLVLTTVTWVTATGGQEWGGWTTAGLALLFLGFGHAPLPRLARNPAPANPMDAIAVVLAPFLFLVAASPYLVRLTPHTGGAVLLALAAVECAVALWLDARRERRDVWNGVVAGAVVFGTAAVERLLGSTTTPMAWSVEGIAILAVGFGAGSGWLRALGGLVTGLGVFVSAVALARGGLFLPPVAAAGGHAPSLFTPALVRGLVEMGALFVGEHLYRRERAHLAQDEAEGGRAAFGVVARAILFAWIGRFALRIAAVFVGSIPPPVPGMTGVVTSALSRAWFLGGSIAAAAWMALALVFVVRGARPGEGLKRICGYAVALGAGVAFLVSLGLGGQSSAWAAEDLPLVHPAGLFGIAFLLLGILLAVRLDRLRARLSENEASFSDVATLAVNALVLPWSAQQASRVVHFLPPETNVHLAAVATSAAWIVQAVVLVALGWGRTKSLLRWTGLGILGLTLLKVMLIDLAQVGVFWRFVVAIGFGVVLMLVSYAYQRLHRRMLEARATERPGLDRSEPRT